MRLRTLTMVLCVVTIGASTPHGTTPVATFPGQPDAESGNGRNATYTVNDTGDESDGDTSDGLCDTGNADIGFTGRCTLRAAWEQADATVPADEIAFALGGERVITTRGMPEMTSPITIDGATDAGNIVLDGSISTPGASGLTIAAGGSFVSNLTIHSFDGSGVLITGGPGTVVSDCRIGVDENGAPRPNGGAGIFVEASSTGIINNVVDGIVLFDVSSNLVIGNLVGLTPFGFDVMDKPGDGITLFGGSDNRIGGTTDADRNVISSFGSNGIAIGFGASGNTVEGNYIGTDVLGTSAMPNGIDGVHIIGATSNVIRNNVISGNGEGDCEAFVSCDGIDIRDGSTMNVVVGNYIGLAADGTAGLGNRDHGVFISNAPRNRIGGPDGVDRNVISGNGRSGVMISGNPSTSNAVVGNWIGIDAGASGTKAIPNGEHGVLIDDAPTNGVASPMGAGPNIISGNIGSGIVIRGQNAVGNVLAGARIGLDKAGLLPEPNAGHGVLIEGGSETHIGHLDVGGGSTIAYNGGDGIRVTSGKGHTIRWNAIYENDGLGIDLGGDGVTTNDPGDGDDGANGLQNFPVITKQDGGLIQGTINTEPGGTFTLDFYSSKSPDPTEHGEGGSFLGSVEVTTDDEGHADFVFGAVVEPEHVTATATDEEGSTSEFSRGPISLTVNQTGDEPDANLADATCDTDLDVSGDQCTLRAAIQQAEANAGEDTIDFDIPEPGKQQHVPTIRPNGPLPALTEPTVIDGTTQPGEGLVEVDGSNAGAGVIGLRINGGSSTIRGLVINRFASHGIQIAGDGSNTISGNRIGTNAEGDAAAPNGGSGIYVDNVPSNLIGGLLAVERNVISGNGGHGILISGAAAASTEVLGNWIGIDAGPSGTDEIGNVRSGIRVINAPGSVIGGTSTTARNIISGNGEHGIHVSGAPATGQRIRGNWIGTDKGAMLPAGNDEHGILIDGASDNFIGGVEAGEGNVIAHNGGDGVRVDDGLRIRIRRNAIFSNGGLGIDLAGDGVTLNDDGDGDGGANLRQNFPVFTEQETDLVGKRIKARLESKASTTYTIDIFSNSARDPSGYGEGAHFLYSEDVEIGPEGVKIFEVVVNESDRNITTTVTDPDGNTSEFSRGLASLVVNVETDKPDAALADGACDTDLSVIGDQCSLRAAIQTANANADDDRVTGNIDRITFDIPGAGVRTIELEGALPEISDRVVIDATSQPGYKEGQPLVELNGGAVAAPGHGLVVTVGESVIRGLIINRFKGDAILLRGAGANTIQSNFIGTDAAGTTTDPDTDPLNKNDFRNGGSGIHIEDIPTNLIGGIDGASSNVISGNVGAGILIEGANATGNKVYGNLIGTTSEGARVMTADGRPADTNTIGIRIIGAPENRIGIVDVPTIVSGNRRHGITIEGEGATQNVVTNSRIGLGPSGGAVVPNGSHGIYLLDAPDNTIGFVEGGGRNRIAGNDSSGVALRGTVARINNVQGNDIGIDPATIDTAGVGNRGDGVLIDGARTNRIGGTEASQRNVISGNRQAGVRIAGEAGTDNVVLGNYVGVGPDGDHARPNGTGVLVIGAPANIIGGDEAADRNVISGNRQHGVLVSGESASGNRIYGNYIGTNDAASGAIPNEGSGVAITHAPNTDIGFATDVPGRAPGNVIAGNLVHGVEVFGAMSEDTEISGNSIGIGAAVTDSLGNGRDGVRITDASGVTVGGINAAFANRIGFNEEDGVRVISNAPTSAVRNGIFGNSIFANGGLGIDLGDDGQNPPFMLDTEGANQAITPPELSTLERDRDLLTVKGTFISWPNRPNATFEIEYFANDGATCDASGYGEGGRFLERQPVTTGQNGSVPLRFVGNRDNLACTAITATATAPDSSTSEFSGCIVNKEGCLVFADALEFRHQRVASGEWVEVPERTTDGNRVRITSTIESRAAVPLEAELRYVDVLTDTPLRDSLASDRLSPTVAANGLDRVSYRWNTNGFAWNDDRAATASKPQSDRLIKVTLSDDHGVVDSLEKEIIVQPRPVVMVHGLWSSSAVWSTYKTMLAGAHPLWRGFAVGDRLAPGRMNTGAFPTTSPIGAVVSVPIDANAGQLDVYIAGVRDQETAHHVDIVAHSMGGLISRYYLDKLMPASRDPDTVVRELAMLATPNMGSPCADDLMVPYLFWALTGQDQFVPHNLRQLTRDYIQRYFNPRITNIHGVSLSIAAGNPWTITCHSPLDGDMVVETTSAFAEGTLDMKRDILRSRKHTDFPHDANVFKEWVKPMLDDGPGDVAGKRGTISRQPSLASRIEPEAPQYIDGRVVMVPRDETTTIELSVPEAERFGVSMQAHGAVASTLRDPGGMVVERIDADSDDALNYFRTHAVESPQAGMWILEVEHSHADHDSLAVVFSAWVQGSKRTLDLDVTVLDEGGNAIAVSEVGASVGASNRLHILASLARSGRPLVDETVEAMLRGSRGPTTVIALHDDGAHGDGAPGDGIYGNTTGVLGPEMYLLALEVGIGEERRLAAKTLDLTDQASTAEGANLLLTKTVAESVAEVGGDVTYTITAINSGPEAATGLLIEDPMPEGADIRSAQASAGSCSVTDVTVTCGVDTLMPGEGVTVTIVAGVLDGAPEELVNTATVVSDVVDPNPDNNEAAVSVRISGATTVESDEAPRAFDLKQNYPNPFNPSTTIAFNVQETAHVQLAVYDALGRRVAVLVDGFRPPGRHEATFDASRLPSGTYLYTIEMGAYRARRAMVFLK